MSTLTASGMDELPGPAVTKPVEGWPSRPVSFCFSVTRVSSLDGELLHWENFHSPAA
jgi:hypothetical protein